MEDISNFVLQKAVNWSLLNYGITIPVAAHPLLHLWNSDLSHHGTSKKIKIIIDGEFYDAIIINQNFNENKFAGHKDIIQIRYGENSPVAIKLRNCFIQSFEYLFTQRKLLKNKRQPVVLPNEIHESIRLYLTTNPNVMFLECCTSCDYAQLSSTLSGISEEMYESSDERFFMSDEFASIVQKERLVKYRKIDGRVIQMLKEFYDYRDEISGEKIGVKYGKSVVEAHHIDYFTKSLNNDTTNIVIISPNYHRIIHENNPIFNRRKFQFEFLNGEVLKLKLYSHLL